MRTSQVVIKFLLSLALALSLINTNLAAKNLDPFENYNRKIFAFNQKLDAWVLKPTAKTYRFITPKFFRTGVSNFFNNLKEVPNFANNLLQAKPKSAGKDLTRFGLNSTLGILGLFDVATPITGWQASKEDFGQTLNVWGVPQGPYIVWPLLGGQTLSHTSSLPVEFWVFSPTYHLVKDEKTRWGLAVLYLASARESFLDAEGLIHGDPYTFMRDFYLQNRNFLIQDGRIDKDPFLEADEDFLDEDFDDAWFDD